MKKLKFLYPLFTILILPLIAIVWIIGKAVIPFRKSSSNGMIYLMDDGKKVLYSPYFEFEQKFLETDVLVKVVAKLGNDGVFKGTVAPFAKGVTEKDTVLFREITLFIINQTQAPVEITPKYLEVEQSTISKLEEEAQLIGSEEFFESEPIMSKDKRDRRVIESKVIIEYQGNMYEIIAPMRRLTVEELDTKYKPKDQDANK